MLSEQRGFHLSYSEVLDERELDERDQATDMRKDDDNPEGVLSRRRGQRLDSGCNVEMSIVSDR